MGHFTLAGFYYSSLTLSWEKFRLGWIWIHIKVGCARRSFRRVTLISHLVTTTRNHWGRNSESFRLHNVKSDTVSERTCSISTFVINHIQGFKMNNAINYIIHNEQNIPSVCFYDGSTSTWKLDANYQCYRQLFETEILFFNPAMDYHQNGKHHFPNRKKHQLNGSSNIGYAVSIKSSLRQTLSGESDETINLAAE